MKSNQSIDELRQLIKQDLGSNPAMEAFCLKIVDYLERRSFQEVCHLTYYSFLTLLGSGCSDEVLIDALRYLTGNRANVLKTHFELIDEMDNGYVLDPPLVSQLQKTGNLYHPATGELVSDPDNKVHLFFSPSDDFKELQANNAA